MQLYAITDRRALGDDEPEKIDCLLALATVWARGGVDFIQIREKDLPPVRLLELSRRIVDLVRSTGAATQVLLNGDAALAAESGADGVHLPGSAGPGGIGKARQLWRGSGRTGTQVISVACHSLADVERARDEGADLAIFAPVFGKLLDSGEALPGSGLAVLAAACRTAGTMPVFALGGVTAANARQCIDAGAAGIAAIRLFVGDDWKALRASVG
jgi:thiamine-phosphate pyrophosphorylase